MKIDRWYFPLVEFYCVFGRGLEVEMLFSHGVKP